MSYAGTTQTLSSNGSSNAWNGLSLTAGDWEVSTKLQETSTSYEACNPIGGSVAGSQKVHQQPPRIKIVVSYGC